MLEEILFEATADEQDRKAVVMVGRFQPPTQSHYKVIDLMKKFARANKGFTPIVVVISGKETSKDKTTNPLSSEDRIKFMTASGKANGIKFLQAGSAFQAFDEVRKAGYEPTAIAAGSDRAGDYLKMLDKYFTSKDGSKIQHTVMSGLAEREDPEDDGTPSEEVLKMAEDGEDIPAHLISGSMARLAVKLDLKKAFEKITGLKPALATLLFGKIKNPKKDGE